MAQDLLSQVIDIIMNLVSKTPVKIDIPLEKSQPESAPVQETPQVDLRGIPVAIDWNEPTQMLTPHFSVKDAIYLPTWKRLANSDDGLDDTVKANSIKLMNQMEIVRAHFGKPINVHVSYRPLAYNKAIGGALHSAHSEGLAMDFDIPGMNCDDVRSALTANNNALLEEWKMRCENMLHGNWVHLDLRELAPGGHRFFIP